MGYLENLWNALDFGSLRDMVLRLVSVFLCLTVHETCHGLAALALGDPTAKRARRLSLNPLRHIDWFGLLMMVTVGFGWAKPVPVDPRYFRRPKQGMALTALAGPVSNFLLALVLLFAGLVSLVEGIGAATGGLSWALLASLFPTMGLAAGGLGLLLAGGVMTRRARRFGKYLACAHGQEAVSLKKLAEAADVSPRKVENDLEIMIEKGLWGENAYLDLGSDMLFRSPEAAEAFFGKKQQEQEVQEPPQAEQGYSGVLRDIRRANDRIADPVLSQKIDRLEEVSGKIFDYVKAHPEKLPQIRKFMSYYLPTTLKLLRSYDELSRQGVSGQNITGTMEKVEGMMATIVLAFEKQLDSLFGDQAMDISTDITVLDNMMAREGLTGGDAVHQAAQENPVADPQPELDIRNAGDAQTQPPQAEDSVDAGNGITLEL